jgi:sporulation protein YlmC with PRC-barrel domain
MSRQIDLALGLLDHQIMDVDGRRCGKVDDLELEGIRNDSPSVTSIVVGRRRPVRVPWEKVDRVEAAVQLKVSAGEVGLGTPDDRVRKLVERMPGP